jgi:hypothetical protein
MKRSTRFIVYGEPASKANSRRWTGKFFIKSQKALDYAKGFAQQCPVLDPLIEGDVRVTFHIWYASRRPDLDESLILDLMQDRIYLNDRQVKERHAYWHLDKEEPRAEIEVEQIDA